MLRSFRVLKNIHSSSVTVNSSSAVCRRFLGSAAHDSHKHDAHGHDDHHDDHDHLPHKPLQPYEVPHHATYAKEAYFLGINPNEEYKYEGFEWICYFTFLASAIVLYAASNRTQSFKVMMRYA
jgi:hypothetical protein